MAKSTSLKAIRAKAKELGITNPEIIQEAASSDDPAAFLEVLAPADTPPMQNEEPRSPRPRPRVGVDTRFSLDMPLAACPNLDTGFGPYLSRHVEVGNLTMRQRIGLYRLLHGLQASKVKLDNGKPIYQKVDVIRWLLEQAAAEWEG